MSAKSVAKKFKKAILVIGNKMRGDDGVAIFLGQLVQKQMRGWKVFFGEDMPENKFGEIRKFKPDILIVADAILGDESVEFWDLGSEINYIYATHNLPSPLLISYLRKIVPNTLFLGIGINIENLLNQNLSQNAKISAQKALEKLKILDENLG